MGRRRSILLVAPPGDQRAQAGRLLRLLGYHVLEAATGPSAQNALTAAVPDLIIADVVVEGADPVSVLGFIERGDLDTRAMFILPEGVDARLARRVLDAGAASCIIAPIDLEGLEREVRLAFVQRGARKTRRAQRRLARGEGDPLRAVSVRLRLAGGAGGAPEVVEAVGAPAERPPDVLAGFRLGRILGSGGIGSVFEAHSLDDPSHRVALKVVHADVVARSDNRRATVERFRREAEVAMSIEHPNVPKVHDFGVDAGRLYLTMQLVEGRSAREQVRFEGPLPPEQVSRVGRDVQSALTELHARDLIHRDVKPANLILTPSGSTMLVDLGMAKVKDSALTAPNEVLGTLGYIAPEVIAGRPLDARADQFALGVSLYELLIGRRLFVGENLMHTLDLVVRRELPGLPAHTPEALGALIDRMLSINPGDRFDDDRALLAAFEALARA